MAVIKILTGSKIDPVTHIVTLNLTLNGQGYSLEYPTKQAAFDSLTDTTKMPDFETMIEFALLLVLREWRKTDPNLTNLAGLLNKTCTITLPTVTIV